MGSKGTLTSSLSSPHTSALLHELEYMAYHGRDTAVYELYKKIPLPERDAYQSVYVLNSVLKGGIAQVKQARTVWQTADADALNAVFTDVEGDLDQFIGYCAVRNICPRELFERILDWGSELSERSRTEDTLRLLDQAEDMRIRTYPDLYSRLVLKRADLLFMAGRIRESHRVLSAMAERYYLIPDWNTFSEILLLFCRTSLLTGEARCFKTLLLSGLRRFYTRDDIRRLFTGLFASIYRRFYRVFLDHDLSLSDKFLFLLHWIDHVAGGQRIFVKSRISKATRFGVLGYVYVLNYAMRWGKPMRLVPSSEDRASYDSAGKQAPGKERQSKRAILVTRAMGGIGDLLTMTPGFHALKKKYADHDIHLAVPAKFAPLFAGNDDVSLLDIETSTIDVSSYAKWFNFTDCPAARFESRTAPRVNTSRIDIFARALGIRRERLRMMNKQPRYVVTEDEISFRHGFWRDRGLEGGTVIGVQMQAAEPYRDYPYMDALVQRLAQEFKVIVFHMGRRSMPNAGNVIDPGTLSIRQAFALAAGCDAIIAPDSAFVHFAGALNIPCIAIEGPIGKIGTTYYPSCTSVDVTSLLKCVPCWRNAATPCRLTNMRDSVCMNHITTGEIHSALHTTLARRVLPGGPR